MFQKFALVLGIVYLGAGILGFVPALVSPPEAQPDLVVDEGFGRLFGLFPINWLHNLVHVAVGLWGLFGFTSFGRALGFARGLAILYGILAVMGLIPGLNTLFGLAPLYGHDVWLHAGTALVAAYFGWGAPSREHRADAVR